MRRQRWIGAGVFAAALALRLLHLQQVAAHDPFYDQPSVDSLIYVEWAKRIAGGDWLGTEPFFLSPLYGYLVALVYWIAGPGPFWPLAVNAVLGAGACALVYALAARLFDGRAALLAALLAASYPLEIFYEGAPLLEALQSFLTTAVVWAAVRALEGPTALRFAAAGALLGLSALARQNTLLFAPLFAVWVAVSLAPWRPTRQSVAYAGAFLLAVALTLAPATLYNWAASGDLVIGNATGGLLLYDSWNPSASATYSIPAIFPRALADDPIERKGAYTALAQRALGRSPLRASEVSAYWRGEALAFVGAEPARALAIALERARLFWNRGEPWDVRSLTVSRESSWVLRLPLPGFGVIAPLALAGMVLAAPRWRRLAPLYAMVLVYFVSGVLFVALSRYRVPAVPLLAVFAGAGAVALWDAARARDFRRAALAAGLVALAAFLVNWDEPSEDLSMAYFNLGNAYKEHSQFELATDQYFKSLELAPGYISTWNNLALVYERSGVDRQLTARTWQRVLDLARAQGSSVHAERHLHALETTAPEAPRPE
ncbi:MAG TPA: glycosyltransferase family 39 protein [Myxococcota bacterium]|nr:glycosyltransferase family 39 protein [Myxococcota bacterium]